MARAGGARGSLSEGYWQGTRQPILVTMERDRVDRYAGLSRFEAVLGVCGVVSVLAGVFLAVVTDRADGLPRGLGLEGMLALVLVALARGVRRYQGSATAALPHSVGRTRIRPARAFAMVSVVVALGLPLAAAGALAALVDWAWLPLAGVALIGGGGLLVSWIEEAHEPRPYSLSTAGVDEMLQRLCMRADMAVPDLVIEHDLVANAWTARGRIHLTSPLVERLDRHELEAVIAHEVAHLARRDAAVMELCSAPSRALLGFARVFVRWDPRHAFEFTGLTFTGFSSVLGLWVVALLCVPAAFVVGGLSRLSVLGSSRAREHSADTVAATLTGRPSALASALLKLDGGQEWGPRSDLRQVSVLCIVGPDRSWLGRPFATHPPTATRVKRLQRLEEELQRP